MHEVIKGMRYSHATITWPTSFLSQPFWFQNTAEIIMSILQIIIHREENVFLHHCLRYNRITRHLMSHFQAPFPPTPAGYVYPILPTDHKWYRRTVKVYAIVIYIWTLTLKNMQQMVWSSIHYSSTKNIIHSVGQTHWILHINYIIFISPSVLAWMSHVHPEGTKYYSQREPVCALLIFHFWRNWVVAQILHSSHRCWYHTRSNTNNSQ